jgi:hypothetical protein
MTLTGGTYPKGVINGFTMVTAAADQSAPGTPITFYIDDIEWQ